MAACTPSRLNLEGHPENISPRSGAWGGGRGDLFGWVTMLAEWREQGDFAGFELDQPADSL